MTPPTFVTERLIVRPYAMADFDVFAAQLADAEVMRFIGGAQSRHDAWLRFLRHHAGWGLLGFGQFSVFERTSGTYLGHVGFQDLKRPITPSIEGTIECGWALVRAAWGKGIAVEATTATLAWADAAFPALRQTCLIGIDNTASLRVAAKLGFAEYARTVWKTGETVVLLERALG